MQSVANRKFLEAPIVGGTVLFLCALVFYFFSVLDFDYKKSPLLNLAGTGRGGILCASESAIQKANWRASK